MLTVPEFPEGSRELRRMNMAVSRRGPGPSTTDDSSDHVQSSQQVFDNSNDLRGGNTIWRAAPTMQVR